MEQYIYRRKCEGIYIMNLKRTWEKLLLVAHAMLPLKTQLMSVFYHPGIWAGELG